MAKKVKTEKFSNKLIKALAAEYTVKENKCMYKDYRAYIEGFKKCIEILDGEIIE